MRLPSSQLSSHLERGLSRIYLVAADEPLLVRDATDAIRLAASEQGFTERSLHFIERGFRWESLRTEAASLSLFAARRIIDLRMATPRPGDAGAKAIRSLAEENDPDRLIVISIQSRLDANAARSVWARTIERHGVVVEIRPVTRAELPAFVARRAKRYGLTISADGAELLADRVEGNLLAADQELAKLALIHDQRNIDADAVLQTVATSARFDVFRLSDAVIGGDLRRAMIVLEALRSEGVAPALVLWAVAREIMLLSQLKACAAKGRSVDELMLQLRVWRSRESSVKGALRRYSNARLSGLLQRASSVDRAVKGLDRVPVWEAITGLVLELLAPESSRLPA